MDHRRAAYGGRAITGAVLISLALQVGVLAEVVFTTSAAGDEGTFEHPFDVMNAFYPVNVAADFKTKHPFVDYFCFFNAWGTNPSRPELEVYDEDAGGNPVYHFERLTDKIDTVLAAGLTPYLTLGNSPVKLASDPGAVSSAFGTMTCKVKDYGKYYDFVVAFFQDLDTRYGASTVASWRYRFMTEPDNTQWWTETREEWFKFYDYTVSAARSVNPDVIISPANLMRHNQASFPNWLIPYVERVHNGTFAVAGESPYVPERLTFSFYSPWRINQSGGPQEMETDSADIRAALAPYPEFNNIPLGIDEGYVGVDENNKTLWARVDGTEWGAAHFAFLCQVMMDENWDCCNLWEPGDETCPTPWRNTINLIDEMDGLTKVPIPRTSGVPPSGYYSSALAARDGSRMRIMAACYNSARYASTPTDYRIVISDLAPGTYNVSHKRIDHDHGNYRTQWLIDSAAYTREGDNSQYDIKPLNGLWGNQEAIDLWNANKPAYQTLAADMDVGTTQHIVGAGETLEIAVTMPAHSVSFFDVRPELEITTDTVGPFYEGLTIGLPAGIEVWGVKGTASFSSPDLPAGLSIDPSTGVISGAPAVNGDVTFTVQVSDDYETASHQYSTHIYSQVAGLNITESSVTLDLGVTHQLTAMALFSSDPDMNVTDLCAWTSDDEAVVLVSTFPASPAGLLYAAGPGTATVTAGLDLSPYGGVLHSDSVSVTVTSNDGAPPQISATEVALEGTADDNLCTIVQVDIGALTVPVTDGAWSSDPLTLTSPHDDVSVSAQDASGNSTSMTISVMQ